MKNLLVSVVTIFLMSFGFSVYGQTGTISLEVVEIDTKKGGNIMVGLYNNQGFPEKGKSIKGIIIKIEGPVANHQFENIPAGKYALAVFQDVNKDNDLNTNLFGAPKEPYGFSQNKYGTFGPPDFKDVSFEVKENGSNELTIKLE
ncbi:MAG: DUF2141 domain-containing protein [Proteobacteria bacterium]|nr:DUF2141 domain-containing protein [Pseudomonadota bacterium]